MTHSSSGKSVDSLGEKVVDWEQGRCPVGTVRQPGTTGNQGHFNIWPGGQGAFDTVGAAHGNEGGLQFSLQ